MIAASFDSNVGSKAKKMLLNAQIHIRFLWGGLILVACHGLSTIFLDEDQFFFDQGTSVIKIIHGSMITYNFTGFSLLTTP